MKSTLGILCLLFIYSLALCQSAKDVKKSKIKAITIWQSTKESGPESPIKESYEAFDRSGNTILKIAYKPDGSVDTKETARYDKNENKVEEFKYDGDSQVGSHKTWVYDKFQNKIEEDEFSPSGELNKKTTFTYTPAGDKLFETIMDANGNVLKKVEYRYNVRNLKVQRLTTNKVKQVESVKKWGYEYY